MDGVRNPPADWAYVLDAVENRLGMWVGEARDLGPLSPEQDERAIAFLVQEIRAVLTGDG